MGYFAAVRPDVSLPLLLYSYEEDDFQHKNCEYCKSHNPNHFYKRTHFALHLRCYTQIPKLHQSILATNKNLLAFYEQALCHFPGVEAQQGFGEKWLNYFRREMCLSETKFESN